MTEPKQPRAGQTAAHEAGNPADQLLVGDALKRLGDLPDSSVDMVLTSPPYFRLRNYDSDGQLGMEAHVDQWVTKLLDISTELHRVLVPTGTVWLNLGDTYSMHRSQGAARKSLLLAPERLALELQQRGWLVRNKIVWAKTNPMPSNARDRLSCTYEVVYVLAKNPGYFFDLDSVRQPHRSHASSTRTPMTRQREAWRGPNGDNVGGLDRLKAEGRVGHPLGKNPGDVWPLATSGYRGAHHATFPLTLATRAIQAGCPEARCVACRLPWRRRVIRALGGTATRTALAPTCVCAAGSEPGMVLDPFIGSGTTAVAAEDLGRHWLGIELNPDFAALAAERIAAARVVRRTNAARASAKRAVA
ncbi:DNA-methyltransferase [Antrihabitans sp. NCIMB 15449]|uniref:Methyltransferase n=1 Tax=Antrihabitans spumae TaxID=3373370 RepID=A0ABW7JIR6_9NOCA